MNCVQCKKKVDIHSNQIPPEWYGKYQASTTPIAVICSECIKTKEGQKLWDPRTGNA